MNEEIILVAETGSDLTPQQAQENGIYLVPMHVTMGDQTLDDGSFPPEEVCAYYQKTGTVPKTSASGPFDFKTVFDQLHEQFPNKKILHLAYSAVTTASYHNALLEGEHRDYVTSIDEIKRLAEQTAAGLGYHHVEWMKTGCVITCHGGPGCFGIVGVREA